MISNYKLTEGEHPVVMLAPTTNPSSATTQWLAMKNYNRLSIVVMTANDSTGAAMAVALQQATSVGGAGSKTLAFTSEDQVTDISAGDTFTVTTVNSNTFNTSATASKNSIYVIEVRGSDLDQANGFDYVNVASLSCTHSVVAVLGILRDPRYPQSTDTAVSAVV